MLKVGQVEEITRWKGRAVRSGDCGGPGNRPEHGSPVSEFPRGHEAHHFSSFPAAARSRAALVFSYFPFSQDALAGGETPRWRKGIWIP